MPVQRLSPAATLDAYQQWLDRQPLAARTRATYAAQVGAFLTWLAAADVVDGDPLQELHARDYAVRDYKTRLKLVQHAAPRSINLALAAVDHLYRFLGLDRPHVRREPLPAAAPRALDTAEQQRLVRAVERCPRPRDRALLLVLFYTGLRLAECAALDTADVALSARKGQLSVRAGKGDSSRVVPLNAAVRSALDTWLRHRSRLSLANPADAAALWLSRTGTRLSSRSIDLVVRYLGAEAGLTLSAHTLRHTCVTNLVRQGNDLVLVAELAGHRRLESTRRYSLPTAADRQAAMEALVLEP